MHDNHESKKAGGAESSASDVRGRLEAFVSAPIDLEKIEIPRSADRTPVLERLGASPFPRSGFPLLGILATLYEHVAEHTRRS